MDVSKPRGRWIAVACAVFMPGLGHLYAGRLWSALVVLLLPSVATLTAVTTVVSAEGPLLAVLAALAIGAALYWVAQAWWAGAAAARQTQASVPGWAAQAWPYVLFLMVGVTLPVATAIILRLGVVEAFKIPTRAMMPTLLVGDHCFVRKVGPAAGRSDLVVYRLPNDPRKVYVKRIVGLAGDRIRDDDGRLYVNGQVLAQSPVGTEHGLTVVQEVVGDRAYTVGYDLDAPKPSMPELIVPPGHVFVVGDNRLNSLDSRSMGPVPYENIVGVAYLIFFSFGDDGFRSNRIGRRLR